MSSKKPPRRQRPATTIEGRENQLISKAMDLVEKRIDAGTASAQEVTHFLKMGSIREKLEQQKLQKENLLTSAKVDQLASGKKMEELYAQAIKVMRTYSGQVTDDDDEY